MGNQSHMVPSMEWPSTLGGGLDDVTVDHGDLEPVIVETEEYVHCLTSSEAAFLAGVLMEAAWTSAPGELCSLRRLERLGASLWAARHSRGDARYGR